MTTYLAFLRAINLGAKRVFPRDDIRRVTAAAGFADPETHINTGNVRFDSRMRMRSRSRIESTLESAYAADRGFEVPTIAYSAAEFALLAAETAALDAEHPDLARHYVYLLKDELNPAATAAVEELAGEHGRLVVRGRAAHALLLPGYQDGRVDPLNAARLLGVATNRSHTVVAALAAKWC